MPALFMSKSILICCFCNSSYIFVLPDNSDKSEVIKETFTPYLAIKSFEISANFSSERAVKTNLSLFLLIRKQMFFQFPMMLL